MAPTIELTESTISRFRVVYSCWLLISSLILCTEIYFICLLAQRIPGLEFQESSRFMRTTVTLLFVHLVFETGFLLSGAGALISMSREGLKLHYSFAITSLCMSLSLSLLTIWTNVTVVYSCFIAFFVLKVAAFIMVFVVKHAVIIEPETRARFSLE